MKRFLSIFVIIALAFGFFACKKKNEEPTKQETKAPEEEIVEIDEQNSDVTDLKFAEPKQLLPENPVPAEGPVDLTIALDFTGKIDEKGEEAVSRKANGSLTINFKANSLTFKEFKDLEALATVNILVKGQEGSDEEEELLNLTATLYLSEGLLFANIPGSLLGSEGDLVVSVDLNKVFEAAEGIVNELMETLPIGGEEEGEIDLTKFEEMEEISLVNLLKLYREFVPGLEEAGFSDEFIAKIDAFLGDFLPKFTYENKTFKLSISKDTIGELIDKVVAFAKENLATINGIAAFLAGAPEGTQLVTSETLDTLKPSAMEELEDLTINEIYANFGLDDTNRVNKVDAKVDVKVAKTFYGYDKEGAFTEEEGEDAWKFTVNANWKANEATLKLALSEDKVVGGKSTKLGALSLDASARSTDKGAQAKLKFTFEDEEATNTIEADATWEKIEKGVKASVNVKADTEDAKAELGLNASLVNNGATSVTFEFDVTTAIDMTDTVIGLLGDLINNSDSGDYYGLE